MKNFYIAVQVEENAKMYAYIMKTNDYRNVWYDLRSVPDICCATIMPTKKAAEAAVNAWNNTFRASGFYMFDTMPDGPPAPKF